MIRLTILMFIFILSSVTAEAQYGKKKPRPRSEKDKKEQKSEKEKKDKKVKKDKEEEYKPDREDLEEMKDSKSLEFSERVWYGAGGQLNWGASQGQSSFLIGLSPIAGYKITESFSVGPKLDVQYVSFKLQNGNLILKENAWNLGAGVFSRLRFAQIVFLHGEYQYLRSNQFFSNGSELFSIPTNQNLALFGAGISQGDYNFSYNIYLVYDVLQEIETVDIPIYLRIELARFF